MAKAAKKTSRGLKAAGKQSNTGKGSIIAKQDSYILQTETGNDIVVLPILDPKFDRPESEMTTYEKIKLIEEGISKKALERLKEAANLGYDQLAQILNVARATLIAKKGTAKFSKDVSDKILGLAEIYSFGYEVFGDRDKFNRWIFREIRGLGWKAPFDLLDSSYGRKEVRDVLGRLLYGGVA